MSIQPSSYEHQGIVRELSNPQPLIAQLLLKSLNPELKALISQLVNQPLLIDTLLLKNNLEALITLKPSPSQIKQIQLALNQLAPTLIAHGQLTGKEITNAPLENAVPNKLPNFPIPLIQLKLPTLIAALIPSNQPIELKTLIESLKSADKVSIAIANNQQILIKIVQPKLETAQIHSNIQLTFTKIQISPSGDLTLSNPINTSAKPLTTKVQPTNSVQTLDLNTNIGKIASSLISPPVKPNLNLATNFTQIEQVGGKLLKNLVNVHSSVKTINNYIIQVENIAQQKDVPLDLKTPELVKSTTNALLQNIIKTAPKIQKLIETINKPLELDKLIQTNTTENTKHLVSRIIKSGNLFESAIKQQLTKSDKNSVSVPSTIPIDNKLLLNQIALQLEKLLVEINRYTEKPITTSQIERVEKLLLSQVKDFLPIEKQQLQISKNNTLQKLQSEQQQIQNLIKLSQSLQSVVKNSLQQIEHNQLNSLKSEQFNLQQFLVDLPIKQNGLIDSFEMRFESQDKNSQSSKSKYWKVVVRFDLEPLGPMFAEIQFENEKISTHIFAEKGETAQLINQHLPTLKRSLFSAGVDINKVTGSQGNIPKDLKGSDDKNIDIHA